MLPALGKPSQEFEAILCYIVSLSWPGLHKTVKSKSNDPFKATFSTFPFLSTVPASVYRLVLKNSYVYYLCLQRVYFVKNFEV